MKRILIIKPSSMGDIIHGLLVAEAIHAQLPDVTIDWVVRREFAPLVQSARVIDHTYIFERDGGVSAFVKLIGEIRRERYDAVLDMQGLARSGILTFFAKAGRKIGRADAREGAGLACREKTAPFLKGEAVHAAKILAGFLDVLGLNNTLSEAVRFDASASELVWPTLAEGQRRLLIFPESRRAEKNWSGYESLTRELLEALPNLQILWCGHVPCDPDEAFDTDRFTNLTGKTGIDQLPQLLSSADCVVSNDSGPMHLAAALARPLVAIFGPTDPARFGPYPKNNDKQRVLRRADGDIRSLTVEEVRDSVLDLL